jgi:hypothetical protein
MKTTRFFELSISKNDPSEVAVINRSTGKFELIEKKKKSKTIKAIVKKFKAHLNSKETVTFSHMSKEDVNQLTLMLI